MNGKIDVKKIRESLHLTQADLAIKLKVEPVTISRWELKKHRPSPVLERRLLRLANKINGKG